jgi:hypothetical protein
MEPTKLGTRFRRLQVADENKYFFRRLHVADEINNVFSSASFWPTKLKVADEIA